MSDLERALVELGRSVHVPEPSPISARVASQLRKEARPKRRRLGWLVVAPVAVALLTAVAIPQARTALERILHIGGVQIERVDQLPAITPRAPLAPGRAMTLASAQRLLPFVLSLPASNCTPDHVSVAADPPGGQVTMIYGNLKKPRLLITEFKATRVGEAYRKAATPRTAVETTTVAGAPAIWLGGATHTFGFVDNSGTTRGASTRLAGNTLVWQRNGITYRLEAKISKDDAIDLATTFRPSGLPALR